MLSASEPKSRLCVRMLEAKGSGRHMGRAIISLVPGEKCQLGCHLDAACSKGVVGELWTGDTQCNDRKPVVAQSHVVRAEVKSLDQHMELNGGH